jgi:hypothetical protein
MKLERLPEYATFFISIALGMLVAIYVGVTVGAGSKQPLIIIGGGLAIALALVLKQNVWLLIPLCGGLSAPTFGTNFGLSHFVIVYAFVVFLMLRALKIVRNKPAYIWLDYLLFINVAYLASVFIRNPVGGLILNSDRLGGRPYAYVAISLLAYYVLSSVTLSPKMAFRLPAWMVVGNILNSLAGAVGVFFPRIGQSLGHLYGAFDPNPDTDVPLNPGTDRQSYLASGGISTFQVLCSYFPPLSLLNPTRVFRFVLTLLAVVAVLKTGFRSYFFGLIIFFLFATYFRSGKAAALRIPLILVPLLGLLIAGQGTLFNLPLNIQRTLSFLPGHWNSLAKSDAEGSTQWRIEIWTNVWKSGHKYIDNWWFGDGWGMTKNQYRENLASTGTQDGMQESLTVSGAYHSLPLSTIHIVGYVGLGLMVIQLSGMAVYAWKLLKRAKGTPYFPLSILVVMPYVYELFTSMLIFGAYELTAPGMIVGVAWMRLISRSLDRYLAEKAALPAEADASALPELDAPPRFNV